MIKINLKKIKIKKFELCRKPHFIRSVSQLVPQISHRGRCNSGGGADNCRSPKKALRKIVSEHFYRAKFSYFGYIQYDEVIRNILNADLLPAVRSSHQMENFYNCGSKVLKSMMCGRPTLVNRELRGKKGQEKTMRYYCGCNQYC